MINIIKIIYINLLGLFDFNKILIAHNDGVKSNNERKLIILVVIGVMAIYLFNTVLQVISFNNPLEIFLIGFIVSTLLSFLLSDMIIDSTIFMSDDIELLFSLPLTKNQIIYSKLFNVFIRNIVFNIIVILVCLVRFNSIGTITNNLLLMLLVSSIFISVLPIVIVSILSFINNYIKVTRGKIINNLFRFILLFIVGIISYLLFYNVSLDSMLNRLCYAYPLLYLFKYMILNNSNLLFIVYIIINVAIIVLYSYIVSDNYSKICSLLRGVDKKSNYTMTKLKNKNSLFGYIRKDIRYLISNRSYKSYVLGLRLICSFCLVILFIVKPNVSIDKIYLEYLLPVINTCICSLGCYTICSYSLEKDHINIVKTLPISIGKVLFSKWLLGFIIGLLFIIVNSTLFVIYFNTNIVLSILLYLMPISFVMFIEGFSLLLDVSFTSDEYNDDSIIRGRLISYIPILLSIMLLLYGILSFGIGDYKYAGFGLSVVFIFGLFICFIYYLIRSKKLK